MALLVTNNAVSTLAAGIGTTDTAITLATGDGNLKFPTLASGDYFKAYLVNSSNQYEIVKVTARSGDSLTVTRAQEGTTAMTFSSGDAVELRLTAEDFNAVMGATAYAKTLLDDADAATARGTLGLGDVATRNVGTAAGTAAAGDHVHTLADVTDSGTAASLNVGTSANNVVQLDGSAKLPAVDGSQLTGLSFNQVGNNILSPHKNLKSSRASTTTVTVTADAVLTTDGTSQKEAATVSLTLNQALAAGTLLGLDTGTWAAGWYYLWVLTDGTNVSGCFSASSSAPTLIGGYSWHGLVGAVYWDGSAFRNYTQIGNKSWYPDKPSILSSGTASTLTAVDYSAYAPPNAGHVKVAFTVTEEVSTAGTNTYASISFDGTNVFALVGGSTKGITWANVETIEIPQSVSGTLYYSTASTDQCSANMIGWEY